ncbi:MAG: hypothetical protein QXI58_04525, partial [Candidatus Micrarchaeia archaeon]
FSILGGSAGLVAWKYKAYLEFAAIICSIIGGFIVGLILTHRTLTLDWNNGITCCPISYNSNNHHNKTC